MTESLPTEFRSVTYRLLPGSRERARQLVQIAGACRFVWNEMLDQQEQLYAVARMCGSKPPAPTFFTLGKAFTQLRRVTPWLQDMPYKLVRHSLKHQADAWRAFFRGQAGHPRFKSRYSNPAFTIPEAVRIRDRKLAIPKLGWLRLQRRGGNPYPEGDPKSVAIKRVCGKWYAVVCYAIPAVERPDNGEVVGVDMNAGQVATSEGEILHAPDTRRLEARLKRYSPPHSPPAARLAAAGTNPRSVGQDLAPTHRDGGAATGSIMCPAVSLPAR